jgi:hypothetical protein
MLTSLFSIKTLTGQPVKVKDTELRVRSQVVQIRLPGISGGLIWNRPVAVVVSTPDGRDQILPIRDVTRTAMLALAGLCFASTFLFMIYKRMTT